MSTLLDLADNSSDSEDDVDYVPPAALSDLSEDDEAVSSDEDTKEGKTVIKKTRKARKIEKKKPEEAKVEESAVVDEKQKANDIWKSFLDEVKTEVSSGASSVPVSLENDKQKESCETSGVSSGSSPEKKSEVLLEFAGEVVSVTSDGCLNTGADTSLDYQSSNGAKDDQTGSSENKAAAAVIPSVKRKGLDSVLSTIMNKKQKITTLQKTLIDWKSFKKEEGIETELEKFNRGKGGYLERQRFLEKSDLRSFEVEKAMRLSRTKKK